MQVQRTIEKVAKLTDVRGQTLFLFPRYTGHSVIDAKTIVNASVRGKELPFQKVYTNNNRSGDFTHINMYQVAQVDYLVVNVPPEIVGLYTAPEEETPEEEAIRLKKIEDYFNS